MKYTELALDKGFAGIAARSSGYPLGILDGLSEINHKSKGKRTQEDWMRFAKTSFLTGSSWFVAPEWNRGRLEQREKTDAYRRGLGISETLHYKRTKEEFFGAGADLVSTLASIGIGVHYGDVWWTSILLSAGVKLVLNGVFDTTNPFTQKK